ncbi:MAG: tripartite tricarboxylate transporter substrate binding protein [Rhizobiales bacterium]|nr:tripartite tricarboxylate transporter substrate binding protein [Hyphomicrobiales bacterium]
MNRRECLLAFAATLAAGPVAAQGFPVRPVTILNGYAPGGSTDIAARIVGEGMSRHLGGKPFVVENRPGASGTVAASWLKRQEADGYTLLLSESSSFAIWPAMYAEGVKYDPLGDFDWVATICTSPMVFIVSPDFPARNLAEALDLLGSEKSKDLNYSSSGAGSIPHIAAELLRSKIGPKNASRHIPYRGGAPAVLSVSKGETAWGVASLGSASGLMQGGLVRALAVTSPSRFPLFSDIPTFGESGLKEMELNIFYLVHAPSGLPSEALDLLNKSSVAALTEETTRLRFLNAGMLAWDGENTAASTKAIVATELDRFKGVATKTGIRILG